MERLKAYVKMLNIDWVFSVIAGVLAGLVLKGYLENLLYGVMLSFSPVVPDIFLPRFYPDLICAAAGGFLGFAIYSVYNKKSSRTLKKAVIVTIIAIAAFNVMFFLHSSYLNHQLSKEIESLDSKNKFIPTEIRIHSESEDSLMVGNEYRSTGLNRSLLIKESSPYMNTIYEEIQKLRSQKINEPYSDSEYTVWINYSNNKRYTGRLVWVEKNFAHERRVGIHNVKYNSEPLLSKLSETMKEFRDLDESKREYFSAQWYDANYGEEDSDFIDVSNAGLLFDAMLSPQNYDPTEEEKEFYGGFFNKQTITPKDGDLIALFYTIDTQEYEYIDVLLYDRTKKLLIFKDKDSNMQYVEQNLDELFQTVLF